MKNNRAPTGLSKIPSVARVCVGLWVFLIFLVGCEPRGPQIVKRTQFVMGTLVEITVVAEDNQATVDAITQAFREMQRVEKLMSRTMEGSEVRRINRVAWERPVEVSRDLLSVVQVALEISRLSDGAFDITVGILVSLWTRCWKEDRIPSDQEIAAVLRGVGYRGLDIDKTRKTLFLKKKGMELTLGGIAKGYAVDQAFRGLQDQGFENLIVNAGGDLRTGGTKLGALWVVGIQDPRDKSKIMTRMRVTDAAVATSGDYERYFMKNGVRYHHILDPRTGFPSTGCRSVTVLCDELVWADSLATAVFVLGPERGLSLVEKLPHTETWIVDGKGQIVTSSGMWERVRFE